jgi:predicted negative regulator of RcsB-dependent stress response
VWQKIKSWYQENGCWLIEEVMRWLFIVIFIFFVVLALYLIWEKFTAEPVTTMSQQQAENPTGVQKAADNAGVTLDAGQAKDVSTAIKEIRVTEKEPVYVIQTTGENAKEESEKAVKQEQADFAIVTAKDDPEKEVSLDELDKDTKVELNQYNIQAFKKNLNTVEYQPVEKVVGYTHQWKVTDDGRYMGVGIDYDLDDKKVYAKITYTW